MTTDATIPDDVDEPTRLLKIDAVREALGAIDDEVLASGDVDQIRSALASAVWHARFDQIWREGLVGAGLDSPAGRRVLSAVRHAVAALPLDAIARNVRQARDLPAVERSLAQSLWCIERSAAGECDNTIPDLWDVYVLRTGACWVVPRDPHGQPRYWNRRTQQLEADSRRGRDWCMATIGEIEGASWKKARIGSVETLPQAAELCRRQPGQGDAFQRALEAERNGEG